MSKERHKYKGKKHVSNIPHREAVDITEHFDQVISRVTASPILTLANIPELSARPKVENEDPIEKTLQAVIDLDIHQGFVTSNSPEQCIKYGHGDMGFDPKFQVKDVYIWVGSAESHPGYADNSIPERTIFLKEISDDNSPDDVQVLFIREFAALGVSEVSILIRSDLHVRLE